MISNSSRVLYVIIVQSCHIKKTLIDSSRRKLQLTLSKPCRNAATENFQKSQDFWKKNHKIWTQNHKFTKSNFWWLFMPNWSQLSHLNQQSWLLNYIDFRRRNYNVFVSNSKLRKKSNDDSKSQNFRLWDVISLKSECYQELKLLTSCKLSNFRLIKTWDIEINR